jgi:exportin-2 (importin alpha re-exporter)
MPTRTPTHRATQVSQRTGQDNLAMSAIRFLTTVARSVHCKLFADAAVMRQVCESIVLPNLKVRCVWVWVWGGGRW